MRMVEPAGVKAMGHYMPGIISGNNLFVSGQLPIESQTGKIISGDAFAQTEQALYNMEKVLLGAGITREQVVMMHVYVADIAYWDKVNEAYAKFFGSHKPTRTVVPTGKLHHGALVEVEAVAEMRAWTID